MSRRLLVLAAVVTFAGCDVGETPVGPPDDLAPQPALYDGSILGGPQNAFFLPPLVPNPSLPGDIAFGPDWTPTVQIRCLVGCTSPGDVVLSYGPGQIEVNLLDELYQVNWDTSLLGGTADGDQYAVEVLLPDPASPPNDPQMILVASADVEFASNGSGLKSINDDYVGLKDGRTAPVKFWLGEFVLTEAVQNACEDALGTGVIDCDVAQVPAGTAPPPLVVQEEDGTPFDVGQLVFADADGNPSVGYGRDCFSQFGAVPACEVAYTAVMEHVDFNPAGDIPDDEAFPYFVVINLFQANGDPVTLSPGATLDLCQNEAVIPVDPAILEVFKADGGTSVIIPSQNGTDGFCDDAGNGGIVINSVGQDGSVLQRLSARLTGLARTILGPRALHATAVSHGGKRTTGLSDFSGIGTTLPASVPLSGDLYSVNSSDDGLSYTDLSTGSTTFVGALSANRYVTPVAMTASETQGTFFVWNNSEPGQDVVSVTTGELLRVTACGSVTNVNDNSESGPSGTVLGALAYNANTGQLLGVTGGPASLYSIDPSTGLTTLIGPVGTVGNLFGLDFDASGTLYGLTFTSPPQLVTINPATGAVLSSVDLVGAPSGLIGSLVVDANGAILGNAGSNVFQIDPSTGAASNVTTIGTSPQGMAFGPDYFLVCF